jgi:hypothetical protein
MYVGQLCAQRLGLLPACTKWHQLRHDSLRILYPEGQEIAAARAATIMLKLAKADPIVHNGRYKPITILLQPQTNISNGYVGLAPYKSEFYLQPHENPFVLGSLPWTDLLSLHEYRHVQQLNAAKNGFTNIMRVIFGDLVFSGLYNLSVPDWYREGDAVYTESKWSHQGRGRLSQFTLPFYLKALEGKPWNYYKVRNGSYREFIPDHYALGYMLVQYGNQSFGEATWDTIMHNAPRFKNLIRPFSRLIKDHYGKYSKGLYLDAMDCYRDECSIIKSHDVLYEAVPLSMADVNNDYFDMQFPMADGDGSIYTSITTFDRTTAIHRIDQFGKRTKVISTGLQKDSYFDYSNDRFVWTEHRTDPRWLRKDLSVLCWYDQKTNQRRSFKPEKGYFTPSLSMRGDKIVVLHVDMEGKFELHILDAISGELLHKLPNPDNLYLGYPVFSADEKSIIATARNKDGRMCLVEQDLTSANFRYITHYSYAVLGRPAVQGPWIFVTSGMGQLDQVYAVDYNEGIFYQVSEGNTAHYDPTWDPVQNEIVCSAYGLKGNKLVRLPGDPREWKLVNLNPGIKEITGEQGRNILAEGDETRTYETRKYSMWADAIRPHSWVVTADDPVWGIEVKSDNYLNTITVAGGIEYNRDSKAQGPYVEATFGMFYPELSVGVNRTSREVRNQEGDEFEISLEQFNATVAVPLSFTSGVYSQSVYASTGYSAGFRRVVPEIMNANYDFNYADHRLVLVNRRKAAYRQSMPSFAQRLDLSYSYNVSGISISQLYGAFDLALPGMRASHYTLIESEYLEQDLATSAIQLNHRFSGARGFPFVEGEKQYHVGITYGFPVWYPDRGIGNVFYMQRIRLQPFFDYAYTNDPEASGSNMRSAGAELVVDFAFPPVTLGFRYSRLLSGYDGSANQFEFFIPSQRF